MKSVPAARAHDRIRSAIVLPYSITLRVPCVCRSQSEEDKLIKLDHTLQGWKNEHLGRMEMLFHYTSCEVCPHLPNCQPFLSSALLPSSYMCCPLYLTCLEI